MVQEYDEIMIAGMDMKLCAFISYLDLLNMLLDNKPISTNYLPCGIELVIRMANDDDVLILTQVHRPASAILSDIHAVHREIKKSLPPCRVTHRRGKLLVLSEVKK